MIEVIHGDCFDIMKMIPDNSIDLVLTDPPYGMHYVSSRRNTMHPAIQHDDNLERVPDRIRELYRVQRNDTHAYIFCNDYGIHTFREEARRVGYTAKRTLVWVKNNHTSGDLKGDYANITEFCVFLHKGRRNLNGKRERNILHYNREDCSDHPTVKNKEMIKYLIEKSSTQNEKVLDCFAGSGTTGVACKELGRDCILIEKEKKYIDIIQKRLENTAISLFHQ